MCYETTQRLNPRNRSFLSADSMQCRDVRLFSTLTGPAADEPYQDNSSCISPHVAEPPHTCALKAIKTSQCSISNTQFICNILYTKVTMTIRSTPAATISSITNEDIKSAIDAAINILGPSLRALNHQIYSNPETAYTEYFAHDTICTFLESLNSPTNPISTIFPEIKITRHAYNLETSFEAIAGTGGRMVNFNAE